MLGFDTPTGSYLDAGSYIYRLSCKCACSSRCRRYASVDESGCYSSPIPTVSARFGTMVGGLTMGRILIAQVGVLDRVQDCAVA